MSAPSPAAVLQDAHLAWSQGASETVRFPDFGSWAVYWLQRHGIEATS